MAFLCVLKECKAGTERDAVCGWTHRSAAPCSCPARSRRVCRSASPARTARGARGRTYSTARGESCRARAGGALSRRVFRRDATAGGGRGWSTRGRARIAREELGSVGSDAEVARLTLPRQAVEGAHRLLHGANGEENTPRRAWAVNVLSIGGNRRMKTKTPI